jgi:hypothetical protein
MWQSIRMWEFLKNWNSNSSSDENWMTRRLIEVACFVFGVAVASLMHGLGLPGY